MHCSGILLAAGRGRRFDPGGQHNKLLQCLPNGDAVVLATAQHLAQALPVVLVVLPPESAALTTLLAQAGFRTTCCADADAGMGHSLAHAISCSVDSPETVPGWIIALADMPYVLPSTIAALDLAIRQGAEIAVPVYQQRRGNPVGFSRRHQAALLRLHGDQGARQLLHTFPVTEVAVDDPGILLDIDVPADMLRDVPVGFQARSAFVV